MENTSSSLESSLAFAVGVPWILLRLLVNVSLAGALPCPPTPPLQQSTSVGSDVSAKPSGSNERISPFKASFSLRSAAALATATDGAEDASTHGVRAISPSTDGCEDPGAALDMGCRALERLAHFMNELELAEFTGFEDEVLFVVVSLVDALRRSKDSTDGGLREGTTHPPTLATSTATTTTALPVDPRPLLLNPEPAVMWSARAIELVKQQVMNHTGMIKRLLDSAVINSGNPTANINTGGKILSVLNGLLAPTATGGAFTWANW